MHTEQGLTPHLVQRDHNFLGSVQTATYVSGRHQTARAVKVIPFPTARTGDVASMQPGLHGIGAPGIDFKGGQLDLRAEIREEA